MTSRCRYCAVPLTPVWRRQTVQRSAAAVAASTDLAEIGIADMATAITETGGGTQELTVAVWVDVARWCCDDHRWADRPHRPDNPRLAAVLGDWRTDRWREVGECEGQEALW